MKDLFSFFSRIPVKGDIIRASRQVYLLNWFGFLISLVFFLVFEISKMFLPKLMVSFLTVLSIFAVIGLIHIDGLTDFADGVMKKGDINAKIKALKDVNTGVAGNFLIFVDVLGVFIAVYIFNGTFLNALEFFTVSEMSAKTSMIGGIALFKTPTDGLAAVFKNNYRDWYMPVAIISILPLYLVYGNVIFFSLIGLLISIIIGFIAYKNFGFVNGDSLGAMNEISRIATMWSLCIIL